MKEKIIVKQQEEVVYGVTVILNTKVKAIEKHYLLKKHLNKIRPYLKDTINNFKKSETSIN